MMFIIPGQGSTVYWVIFVVLIICGSMQKRCQPCKFLILYIRSIFQRNMELKRHENNSLYGNKDRVSILTSM